MKKLILVLMLIAALMIAGCQNAGKATGVDNGDGTPPLKIENPPVDNEPAQSESDLLNPGYEPGQVVADGGRPVPNEEKKANDLYCYCSSTIKLTYYCKFSDGKVAYIKGASYVQNADGTSKVVPDLGPKTDSLQDQTLDDEGAAVSSEVVVPKTKADPEIICETTDDCTGAVKTCADAARKADSETPSGKEAADGCKAAGGQAGSTAKAYDTKLYCE